MHTTPALLQFEHGCFLSHRTFRFLQVVHDLGFKIGAEFPFVGGDIAFWELFESVSFAAVAGSVACEVGDVGLAEKFSSSIAIWVAFGMNLLINVPI